MKLLALSTSVMLADILDQRPRAEWTPPRRQYSYYGRNYRQGHEQRWNQSDQQVYNYGHGYRPDHHSSNRHRPYHNQPEPDMSQAATPGATVPTQPEVAMPAANSETAEPPTAELPEPAMARPAQPEAGTARPRPVPAPRKKRQNATAAKDPAEPTLIQQQETPALPSNTTPQEETSEQDREEQDFLPMASHPLAPDPHIQSSL